MTECAEQTHKLVNSKELLISQKHTAAPQAFSEPEQQTTKKGKMVTLVPYFVWSFCLPE